MKTCTQVMTKNPVCCLPQDVAEKVGDLMKSYNIGSLPVIEDTKSQKLVGIITDRDLAMKVVAEGLNAKSVTVEKIMSHTVITCHADDDVQKAVNAMSENQLRRIPIVDSNNRILGIISQADVATRVDEPQKTAEMVKEISRVSR
jgi:CBS domain-containing protein